MSLCKGARKMVEDTRMRNDMATIGRRDAEDKELSENRIRNDKETFDRREKTDLDLDNSRTRNDKITAERRREKDVEVLNPLVFVATVMILAVAVGLTAYFVFA